MKADKQRLKSLGILLLMGLCYYIETQTLGITLKCPLHTFTGLKCPACGLTTACIGLLQGRFAQAAGANWGLTLSLPVLLPWLSLFVYRWLFRKPGKNRGLKAVGIGLVVWFALWGILRNFIGL